MSSIYDIIYAMLPGLYPEQLTTISNQVSDYYRGNLEGEIRRLSPSGLVQVNMLTAVINEREFFNQNKGTPIATKNNHELLTPLPRARPERLQLKTPPPPPIFENPSDDREERIPLPPFFRGIENYSPDTKSSAFMFDTNGSIEEAISYDNTI
jgi:hypothetical protein